MKKFWCRMFGCDRRYNFPSIPSKCICARCRQKEIMDLHTLKWHEVDSFPTLKPEDGNTDDELIKRWFK